MPHLLTIGTAEALTAFDVNAVVYVRPGDQGVGPGCTVMLRDRHAFVFPSIPVAAMVRMIENVRDGLPADCLPARADDLPLRLNMGSV